MISGDTRRPRGNRLLSLLVLTFAGLALLPGAFNAEATSPYHLFEFSDKEVNVEQVKPGGNVMLAQSFTASDSYTLTKISLRISDIAEDDILNVTLQLDEGGLPSGSILAYGENNSGNLPEWVDFVMTPWSPLQKGQRYWIVITSLTGDGYYWMISGNDDAYRMGTGKKFDGEKWSALGKDFDFKNYGFIEARIVVKKIANKSSVNPGDALAFIIFFNNTGTEVAKEVWINDTPPSQLVLVNDSSSMEGGTKIGASTWYFQNVNQGRHFFMINTTVNSTLPGSQIVNTAFLNYTDSKGRPGLPSFSQSTVSVNGPNIRIRKAAEKALLSRGDVLRYTIYFNNSGNQNATFVWINDTLPQGATYLSDSSESTGFLLSKWNDGQVFHFNFTNVTPGGHSFDLNFSVNPFLRGNTAIINNVMLNYRSVRGMFPPSNDSVTVYMVGPKIQSTKSVAEQQADGGDVLHYVIGLSNVGSASAKEVMLMDYLDSRLIFLNSSGGVYDSSNRSVKWYFSDMGISSAVFYLNATVNRTSKAGDLISNYVTVDYKDDLGNQMPANSSEVVTTVVTVPMLAIEMRVNAKSVKSGDAMVYTVFYNNSGNGIASRVWINSTLHENFLYQGGFLENGEFSIEDRELRWFFSNVSPGPHMLQVKAKAKGVVVDNMSIASSAFMSYTDGNGVFAASFVSNPIEVTTKAPRLTVEVEVRSEKGEFLVQDRARPGEILTYEIVFQNLGNTTAKDVWINQTLLPGLTYLNDSTNMPPSVSESLYSWHFTDLAVGERRSFSVTVQINVNATIGSQISTWVAVVNTDSLGQGRTVPLKSNTVTVAVWTEETSIWEGPLPWILLPSIVATLAAVIFLKKRLPEMEEAFLVYKNGLLLGHASKSEKSDQDKDIMTGMFTAVQEFIKDSFSYGEKKEVNNIEFGDYTIEIERGAHLYLAIVHKGKASQELHKRMRSVVAKIERRYEDILDGWSGDMDEVQEMGVMIEPIIRRKRFSSLLRDAKGRRTARQ